MPAVKSDAAVLEGVVRKLRDLTTPGKNRCGVPDAHKEAVRLYVETWITPDVEAVQKDLAGKEPLPDWMRKANRP